MHTKEQQGKMIALREAGATYREIGELFGISLQYAYKIISGSGGCEGTVRTRVRKGSLDIQKIAYEGIYNLFVSDDKMTVTQFSRIAFGVEKADPTQMERIRRFIYNYSDVKFTVQQIKNICEYIGEPFERVFKVRKFKERNDNGNK